LSSGRTALDYPGDSFLPTTSYGYFATAKGAATCQNFVKQHPCLAPLTCPKPNTPFSTLQVVADWLLTPGTFDVRLLAIMKLLRAAKPTQLSEEGRPMETLKGSNIRSDYEQADPASLRAQARLHLLIFHQSSDWSG
jgi:hypothetical protein